MLSRIVGWIFGAYASVLLWRMTLKWIRKAASELDPDKVCNKFDKWLDEYKKYKKQKGDES